MRGLDLEELAARCSRSLTGTSSLHQQLDDELRGLFLATRKSEEEKEEVFVSLDFSVRFLQVIFEDSCIATCNWPMNYPDDPSPTSQK